jgi:2-hydroxychromene-2-carboxylate isomerase
MPVTIDFYFDFISPYSHLANAALPPLAASQHASIDYRPFCLLDLMKIVGNRPTTLECRNKGVYAMTDLQRWAKRDRAPFAPNPFWSSIDFAELGRGAFVAIDDGKGAEYVDAVYSAVFGEPRDLSRRSELLGVLDMAGFDGGRLLERAASAEYVDRLERSTQAAAERGVFGSPTMFVGDEMFFGNDRLHFLTEAVRSAAGSTGASAEQSLEAV